MDTKEKIRIVIGIIINTMVFGLEVYCLSTFIKYLIRGDEDIRFRYFTNISNLTVGLLALVSLVFLLISLFKGKMIYPKVLSVLKLVGITMTTLTFFTVLFVIAPLTSFKEMYGDVRFITHLVTPVLVVIAYLFFEEKTIFEWRFSFLGIVPVVIYEVFYVTNVVFLKTWPDLYKINTRGLWYIFVIVFLLSSYLLALGLYFLKKITSKKD